MRLISSTVLSSTESWIHHSWFHHSKTAVINARIFSSYQHQWLMIRVMKQRILKVIKYDIHVCIKYACMYDTYILPWCIRCFITIPMHACTYACMCFYPPLAGELTIPHIVQQMQNKQTKKQKQKSTKTEVQSKKKRLLKNVLHNFTCK